MGFRFPDVRLVYQFYSVALIFTIFKGKGYSNANDLGFQKLGDQLPNYFEPFCFM